MLHNSIKRKVKVTINGEPKNKYDKLERDFHDKVNNGYKLISKNKRFIKLDASLSFVLFVENVHQRAALRF